MSHICLANTYKATHKVYLSTCIFNGFARIAPGIENRVKRASPAGRVLFLVVLWPGGQLAQDSVLPQQPELSRDSRYFSQINAIIEGYPTAAANIQQALLEDIVQLP